MKAIGIIIINKKSHHSTVDAKHFYYKYFIILAHEAVAYELFARVFSKNN